MSKCLVCSISKEIMNKSNLSYSYLTKKDSNIELKDLVLETNENESFALSTPFVYMFDYSEDEMNQISDYFKSHDIYPIYCASTTKNLLWTLQELLDEIMKEHHLFTSKKTLSEMLKNAFRLPMGDNKQEVERLLMESFAVLQGNDVKKMDEMIEKLGGMLNG